MENIEQILPKSKFAITLQFKEKWLNKGFVHASNQLIRDTSVSPQARLLYILLMSRAFQKDFSYPGRQTLGKELGVSVRSVSTLLGELKDNAWIEVKRRGLGKTNLYFLIKY